MDTPLPPLPVFPPPPAGSDLSSELQYHLWLRIFYRLREGESLVSADTFLAAMEEEYQALTRQPANPRIRTLLKRVIANVNKKHPETFLTNGVQNAIATAFYKSTEKLSWSASDVEQKGLGTIRRFVSGHMRSVLAYTGVDADRIDLVSCVRTAARKVRQSAPIAPVPPTPAPPSPAVAAPAAPTVPAAAIDEDLDLPQNPEVQDALEDGRVTLDELRQRNRQRAETRQTLDREETAKIPDRLDNYARRGLITWAEAGNMRTLQTETGPLKKNARQFVLDRIEQKIRPAISLTVLNLEVFEALKRIPEARDPALEFLVRHRREVLSEGGADFRPLLAELEADPELMANLLTVADRADQEISMIALRLTPYGPLLACSDRDRCSVSEGFVGELRNLDREALSDMLNSPSDEVRSGPTTQVIGLLQLIDYATRPTPFGQELRILKICGQLDDLHRSAADREPAQLERFLKRRLLYLYPDLTRYETEAAERHIDRLVRATTDARAVVIGEVAEDRDPDLDPVEIERGVQIARVSMRVAGRTRYVPYKIMPEEEDPEKYVIVRRDPASGEVVPALRRGTCRYVERDHDGFWKLAS